MHGGSSSSWAGLGLPIDLGPMGGPGCALSVPPLLLVPTLIDTAGQGLVPLTLPNDPSLTGETFSQQFLVLDPAANPLGLSMTAAVSGWIGG